MTTLSDLHARVSARLSTVDFAAIHPGFHAYPFALYTEDSVCLNGRLRPCDAAFRGNTAIEYEDEHIAIWNIEADPISDINLLAGQLVHEMFHCHQRALGKARWPSDLAMLAAPEDAAFYRMKHHEHRLLASAYEQADASAFREFAAVRQARENAFPCAVEQELYAETIEGAAEYAGLAALRMLDSGLFAQQVQMHLSHLRAQDGRLFDARRLCYSSGAVQMVTLERLGQPPKNDLCSPLPLWTQNAPAPSAAPCPIPEYDSIVPALHARKTEQRRTIDGFIHRSAFIPREASICGYDPMNMFRADGMIFCSHFVCLCQGETIEFISHPAVLVLVPGTHDQITGYYKEV